MDRKERKGDSHELFKSGEELTDIHNLTNHLEEK